MHELAVTDDILRVVIKHARRDGAKAVHRVLLVVTELSDLKSYWLQRYFTEISRGTVAAGARLDVEMRAPDFVCENCGASFSQSLRGIERVSCTSCGSLECTLCTAADYVVEEIEVS